MHNDSQGIAAFTPRWPGRYMLKTIRMEKTPCELKGKPFEAIQQRGTLAPQVVPAQPMET